LTTPLSLSFAVIDVQTSGASFRRLQSLHGDHFLGNPFLQNGTFVVRAVPSTHANVTAGDISANSRNERVNLPCRVDASYPAFLADFPNCTWPSRAEDDMFINLTGLYHYILPLNSQYRPRTHIVFPAHANRERLTN
jgi:hypothetical protein